MPNKHLRGNATVPVIIAVVAVIVIVAAVAVFMRPTMEQPSPSPMGTEPAMMDDKEAMMKDNTDTMMKDEEDTMMKKEDAMMKDEDTMMKDDEPAAMRKGSYEPYAASKLALANSGDVVLFFRASWCPTCRALDADIKANLSTIPNSLTILDVNYDTETALKQKYGVTYQHTIVQVDAQGNLIKKWTNSPTLAALTAEVK